MPASSLAALMASPATSGGDATLMAYGQTLPDISLGSLGSSFRSEDEERREEQRNSGPTRLAPRGNRYGARANSPETSNSASIATPSPPHAPASALLSLSPPTTVRKSSSHSALPDSQAPRRPRVLRRESISSAESSDNDAPLEARYGAADTDDDEMLSALSLAVSPGKTGVPRRESYHGGPSRRGGRHSVAAGDVGGNGPLTLRDQEKQLEETKKEVFNLQLENHFLKERLANMAPEHIEAALKENVKLKLEILNLSKELKKLKKLILQQDKDLGAAQRSGDVREMERMWREEKERRKVAEAELKRLQESGAAEEELRAQLEDTEASEQVWRSRAEQLEDELENARATNEDQNEELDRLRDTADRAQDDLETLRAELQGNESLKQSVGLGKGREAKLVQKVTELEQENASLQADLSLAKRGALSEADAELLEEKLNELQDKLAAAQLDLDSRDREIEELNAELDGKLKDHDKELQQVEDEWRDEVIEARAQVDELKDVLDAREQETKDARETLLEREEELAAALEKVSDMQAAQAETHDRLEMTLQNIESDNVEKDAELLAANREVEELGQRVYELEEGVEELRQRESDLNADLKSADEAFENAKSHYETLVAALKEARRKLQDEKDDALDKLRREEDGREAARRELGEEKERYRRALAEKEQANVRLQADLDSTRDRLSLRDRDLISVQTALRSLEDERRKLGDDHTSDRFGLELEIERMKRDLVRCEEELEIARRELDKRDEALRSSDIELARMMDKQRDLENRLASERQGRLNMSDKLDQNNKVARQHERDAQTLRERLEELEPLLTETQQERFALQRSSEQQRQERSELLLRVFKDVNKFLGAERLRSLIQVRMEFEKKIKDSETSVDHRLTALKRQLEQKWRALDTFEASVKKLELTKLQWRSKYSVKEGELEAAKARNAELSQQLSSRGGTSSASSSSEIRSLTERAQAAEKRAVQATNQLAMLEARVAELQSKSGTAENKWEARVKEYENRLRIAGEKIKTEKQGGKERAMQLEMQVRDLERQVQDARKRNQRAEGVVANAGHLFAEPVNGGRTSR